MSSKLLNYKYRIEPNKAQLQCLRQIEGNCRWVWNHFLDIEKATYEETKKTSTNGKGKFNFLYANCKDLTALKKMPEHDWLNLAPAVSLQVTLQNLEKALKASFSKNKGSSRRGFPKRKHRNEFSGSFTLTMVNSARNLKTPGQVYIPKVGDVKVVMHRDLPSDFKSLVVKQEAGKWFVVFTCEVQCNAAKAVLKQVGIDLNSKEFVTSDGVRYAIPKYLRESQAQIKKLQRQMSNKQNKSKNWLKAQLKFARKHYHVRMQRLDFMHKLAKSLVDEYDFIALEDLNVAGMAKFNGHMIKDNGLGMIRQLIQYKSELYGTETVLIGRYEPSSKTCSDCGAINHDLQLTSDRKFVCPVCGHTEDRDLNAAKNIQAMGLKK